MEMVPRSQTRNFKWDARETGNDWRTEGTLDIFKLFANHYVGHIIWTFQQIFLDLLKSCKDDFVEIEVDQCGPYRASCEDIRYC